MGTRQEYTDCMKPFMTGGGPDRKERFCKGAKICSGKASTEQEAAQLCAEAAANPKPPKARKAGKKGSGSVNVSGVAACLVTKINPEELTEENIKETFTKALKACTGDNPEDPNDATKVATITAVADKYGL